MQFAQANRDIESSGITRSKKMGINMDGTAFRILSDGLYSNKIGSMIRETVSNAFDAHLFVDKGDTPVEVHLPTILDPVFRVTDHGPGLDAQEVEEVATTYFSSTKRSTNSQIGGFGLGFKTPFAYCDAWTIIASKDGFKRTYSAYMDDAGEPTVSLLDETKGDFSNGVTIEVPVKSSNSGEFVHEAQRQLQWFNPRPVFTGRVVEFPDTSDWLKVGDIALLSRSTGWKYNASGLVAVCGPVSFPITLENHSRDLSDIAKELYERCDGALFFDIGEIEPAPSREALQYSERTRKAIIDKLEALAVQLKADVTEKVSRAESWIAASASALAFSPYLTSHIINDLGIEYGNHKLAHSVWPSEVLGKDNVGDTTFFHFSKGHHEWTKRVTLTNNDRGVMPLNEPMHIIIDDLESPNKRQPSRVYQFMTQEKRDGYSITVVRGLPCIDTFLKAISGFPEDCIHYMSKIELPAKPKVTTKGGKKSIPSIRVVTNRDTVHHDTGMFSEPVSGEVDGGYYIVSSHGGITDKSKSALNMTQQFPGTVYVIPKSVLSSVEGDDSWVSLDNAYDAYVKENKAAAIRHYTERMKRSYYNMPWEMEHVFKEMFRDGVKPKASPKPFWKLYKAFYSMRSLCTDLPFTRILTSKEMSDISDQHPETNLEPLVQSLVNSDPVIYAAIMGHRDRFLDSGTFAKSLLSFV